MISSSHLSAKKIAFFEPFQLLLYLPKKSLGNQLKDDLMPDWHHAYLATIPFRAQNCQTTHFP